MTAGVPQFGQKRMFSGKGLPQLAQEWVVDCDMLVSLSKRLKDRYANVNDCNNNKFVDICRIYKAYGGLIHQEKPGGSARQLTHFALHHARRAMHRSL